MNPKAAFVNFPQNIVVRFFETLPGGRHLKVSKSDGFYFLNTYYVEIGVNGSFLGPISLDMNLFLICLLDFSELVLYSKQQ